MEEQVGHNFSPFLTLSYLQSALANMPLIVLLYTFPQCHKQKLAKPMILTGTETQRPHRFSTHFFWSGECLLHVTPSTPLAKPHCVLGEGV